MRCLGRVLLAIGWVLTIGVAAISGSLASEPSERGFVYQHDVVPEMPWSIHIVKVDRSRKDLVWTTCLGNGDRIGKSILTDQVRLLPDSLGRPIAAINGDFYVDDKGLPGDPRDVMIREGELISAPAGHASFWIDASGQPHQTNILSRLRVILPGRRGLSVGLNEGCADDGAVLYTAAAGVQTPAFHGVDCVLERVRGDWTPLRVGRRLQARVREIRTGGKSPVGRGDLVLALGPKTGVQLAPGDRIEVVPETQPDLSGVRTALGGGPTLVRDGKPMSWPGIQMRHPRSAIGWNDEWIMMVEVDGRQGGLSVGMTFPELAAYMVKLGCREAMNLDGGGSATMWVLGQVMNSPSEGKERPGANGLVLIQLRPDRKGGSR